MAGRKIANDKRQITNAFRRMLTSKDGKVWFSGVRADLEAVGYAVGGADLCSAGCGAPNIRQRLYWVADSYSFHSDRTGSCPSYDSRERIESERLSGIGDSVRLAGAESVRRRQGNENGRGSIKQAGAIHRPSDCGDVERLADSGSEGLERREEQPAREERQAIERGCGVGGVGFSRGSGSQQGDRAAASARYGDTAESTGFWSDYRLIECRDGKTRRIPTESALFPLAPGLPGRVGLLKGAGNAINPRVAAEFVAAFMEAL